MSEFSRIGGPAAITRWSFLLTGAIIGGAALLVASPAAAAGAAGERLLVAAAGLVGGMVVLALARLAVLPSRPRAARPWLALTAYACAGAAQGIGVVAARTGLGLTVSEPLALVAGRALAAVVWLAVVAVLVDDVRRHAFRLAELEGRLVELAASVERDRAFVTERAQADSVLLAPLRQTLDAIVSRLGAGPEQARVLAEVEELRGIVEREVRPLSHRLMMEDELVPVALGRAVPKRIAARVVGRLAVTRIAAPTWLAVAMPSALAVLFAYQRVGATYLILATPCSLALLAVGFVAVRRLLDSRLPRWPLPISATCV
ncbi:MAG: hypothetical protein ACR2J9_01360, partial [Gaiellales bacterium]